MPTFSTIPGTAGQHVFVYGTLVDPARLDRVLGHRHTGERLRASLPGYKRLERADFAYPFIVPWSGASVDGILIVDLSAADLAVLDAYEEVAHGTYERTQVVVEAWGCGPHPMRIEAYTYVAGVELRRGSAAGAGSEEAEAVRSTAG